MMYLPEKSIKLLEFDKIRQMLCDCARTEGARAAAKQGRFGYRSAVMLNISGKVGHSPVKVNELFRCAGCFPLCVDKQKIREVCEHRLP